MGMGMGMGMGSGIESTRAPLFQKARNTLLLFRKKSSFYKSMLRKY